MDTRPVNEGHLLVVPRAHAAGLAELDPEIGGHMFQTARKLAAALRRSGVRCEGLNLFLADGSAAGQEVFHVHLHVLPRFSGDGFGFRFGPNYGREPDRAALDEVAAAIQGALKE
jgi:diadenosine tetraphosphate (Ap4A) HIT family hydrolase